MVYYPFFENIGFTLLALAGTQFIGALWYSPVLFGAAWMQEVGLTKELMAKQRSKMPFVVAILTSLISIMLIDWMLHALAQSLTPSIWRDGLWVGLLVGGVSIAADGTHAAFSGRSLRLYIIDAGHTLFAMAIAGVIVALGHQ